MTTMVRMLVSISGTRDGHDWPARGEFAELPDDEAASMVLSGLAEVAAQGGVKLTPGAEAAAVELGSTDVEQAADTSRPRARRGGTSGGAR